VASALTEMEAEAAGVLRKAVAPELLQRWLAATSETRADGQAVQRALPAEGATDFPPLPARRRHNRNRRQIHHFRVAPASFQAF